MRMKKRIITIGGSDSLSGGGIQADLATFTEYGFQGLSALTSIVTADSADFHIHPLATELLKEQLATMATLDGLAAVKTGLLVSPEQVTMVAQFLKTVILPLGLPIVIDPVMVFKEAGAPILSPLGRTLSEALFPLATVVTPNLVEASQLTGDQITDEAGLIAAAKKIQVSGPKAVVVKGGQRLAGRQAVDVLVTTDEVNVMYQPQVNTPFNNGAGCTFSAAIASQLALNQSVFTAVTDAKQFVHAAIQSGLPLDQQQTLGTVWQSARRLGGQHEETHAKD